MTHDGKYKKITEITFKLRNYETLLMCSGAWPDGSFLPNHKKNEALENS